MFDQAKLIIAVVTIIASFGAGWKVESYRWDASLLEQAVKDAEVAAKYDLLNRKYVELSQVDKAKEVIIYRDLKKEIPNVTDNRVCFADGAALGLWNNALAGVSPSYAGTITAPSGAGATDKEVMENAVENFEQYTAVRKQLNLLIDWYQETR
ncbi:MAG: hypothetical protein NTW48_09925 [Chloroflexi bacterium]|nr:hypothetical protein [Chloroflexota bacterium]